MQLCWQKIRRTQGRQHWYFGFFYWYFVTTQYSSYDISYCGRCECECACLCVNVYVNPVTQPWVQDAWWLKMDGWIEGRKGDALMSEHRKGGPYIRNLQNIKIIHPRYLKFVSHCQENLLLWWFKLRWLLLWLFMSMNIVGLLGMITLVWVRRSKYIIHFWFKSIKRQFFDL